MRRNLPVYCETSLNPLGSFPLEPINTYTSVTPVLLGALALIYLIRRRESSRVAYTLAILTILTGLGSMAWHTFRTDFVKPPFYVPLPDRVSGTGGRMFRA